MSDVLSSSENTDLDHKKKYNSLGRGFRTFAKKLTRNASTGRCVDEKPILLNNYQRHFESEHELENENLPTSSKNISGEQQEELQLVCNQIKSLEQGEEGNLQLRPLHVGDNQVQNTSTRQNMIAPQNPPPAIPSINGGAIFPKRTQVGSAVEFLNGNGINKVPMNGHAPAKQNGSAQQPIQTPVVAPLQKLPMKTEKLNGKEGHEKSEQAKYQKIKLNGYVGFASLPYQVVRRSQQRGFQFNLLCVGETGTGKTTLLESLFGIKLPDFQPCNSELNTVELKSKQCEITDSNVNVKLRLMETAGFGDQLDKEKSAKVIVNFINDQFEARLKEELMIKRCLSHYEDRRIHACLYFISPTGHGLKALDIVTMKELSKRVNVIPIIAKSDTTSKDELARFKTKILSELRSHNIDFYMFPTDDEAVAEQNRKFNSFVPFAVVGSIDFVTKEDGSLVRARRYPWGVVEVENKEHCDFVYLREAVLRTNVDALRERTQKVLYENYRRERLRELKMRDGDAGANMEEACAQRQKEFKEELERCDKLFNENFVRRVDEKEMEIKRRDDTLHIQRRKIEENYTTELCNLEQKINAANDEKARLMSDRFGKKSKK